MATTEPRNERPNSSTSTPSKIDRKKCAPMPARITFGDHANTELFERKTCGTPAATAVRRIDPRFPGSWIFSSRRQFETLFGSGTGRGVLTTAATPAALTSWEIRPRSSSESARRECAGTLSKNERSSGLASALSLTRIVSAIPPLSWYARTRCSPSRIVLPVLRRSRDDPASLIRALICGLSLERMDFTRWRRYGTRRRCRRGLECRNSSRYWR